MDNTNVRKKKSTWSIIWDMWHENIMCVLSLVVFALVYAGVTFINYCFCKDIFFALLLAIAEIGGAPLIFYACIYVIYNFCIIKRITYLPLTADELKASEIIVEGEDYTTAANWLYFLLSDLPFKGSSSISNAVLDKMQSEYVQFTKAVKEIGCPLLFARNSSTRYIFSNACITGIIEKIYSDDSKEDIIKALADYLRQFDE